MTIGAFSRATGLSPKTLRSYDRLGLLSSAWVDPDTRYRLYSSEQIARGLAIRYLRELELPLLEIGPLLDGDPSGLRDRLLATSAGSRSAPPSSDTRWRASND